MGNGTLTYPLSRGGEASQWRHLIDLWVLHITFTHWFGFICHMSVFYRLRWVAGSAAMGMQCSKQICYHTYQKSSPNSCFLLLLFLCIFVLMIRD